MWEYLALMVISYLLTMALTPKPKAPVPAALKDFDFPQAEEGTPMAVVFGQVWLDGWMVLSVGNYVVEGIESGGGGKK